MYYPIIADFPCSPNEVVLTYTIVGGKCYVSRSNIQVLFIPSNDLNELMRQILHATKKVYSGIHVSVRSDIAIEYVSSKMKEITGTIYSETRKNLESILESSIAT